MPTVRIKDKTYERLMAQAQPLTDSVNDVVGRALDAMESNYYNYERMNYSWYSVIFGCKLYCWEVHPCFSWNEI